MGDNSCGWAPKQHVKNSKECFFIFLKKKFLEKNPFKVKKIGRVLIAFALILSNNLFLFWN